MATSHERAPTARAQGNSECAHAEHLTSGNERLTAVTGAALLVLLAVIGVTIVRIGQLLSVHLFVGILVIPDFGP
jgi:hypothetical protein